LVRWLLEVGGKGSYAGSGVDIEAGDHLVESIKTLAGYTRPGVISSVGGFAALYSLAKEKFKNPLLVTSTDGVGTKAKVNLFNT
jgi:phosphoribosylaminoimidazole (AIR) synthetase